MSEPAPAAFLLYLTNRKAMTMADWIRKLDDFFHVSEREIPTHVVKVSSDMALQKARSEYEQYQQALLNAPSAVEKHFAKSISKTTRLAKAKK